MKETRRSDSSTKIEFLVSLLSGVISNFVDFENLMKRFTCEVKMISFTQKRRIIWQDASCDSTVSNRLEDARNGTVQLGTWIHTFVTNYVVSTVASFFEHINGFLSLNGRAMM